MGLGMSSLQNLLELNNLGYFKNSKSIIEMGSQELHIKKEDLKELLEHAGFDGDLVNKIPNINNWPSGPRASSKHFYSLLGIKEYSSLDNNGQSEVINHDLNEPLEDESMFRKFDIVTDYGTCDCIYNVGECYKTMHKLAKKDGYIIIHQHAFKPFRYYLFDKSFFESIAAANNYKIIFNSFTITPGKKTKYGSDYEYHVPASRAIFNMFDLSKNTPIGIYVVFQKQDNNDFKTPGSYDNNLKTPEPTFVSESEDTNFIGFNRMFLKDPMEYSYIPSATLKLDAPIGLLIKIILKRLVKKFKRIIKI